MLLCIYLKKPLLVLLNKAQVKNILTKSIEWTTFLSLILSFPILMNKFLLIWEIFIQLLNLLELWSIRVVDFLISVILTIEDR